MLNHICRLQSYFFAALFLLCSQSVYSDTTTTVFRHYLKKALVETGSYYGDGIQNALIAGFEEVYSIEISPKLFNHCSRRFQNNLNVHLYLGDSSDMLQIVLDEIDEPVTFWLDGHCSLGNPLTAKGKVNSPIIQELEVIANHHIKTHTLLIDDVRLFGTDEFDYVDKNSIIEAVKKINPDYRITYADGYVPNDVLVAEIVD